MGLTGADYGTVDADEDDEWDGLSLYTYQENDPAGMWRAIFMASDNGGVGSPEWRTHTPLRMLTANGKSPQGRAIYIYKYGDGFPGHHAAVGVTGKQGDGTGTWIFGWRPGEKQRNFLGGAGALLPFFFGKLTAHWLPGDEDPIEFDGEGDTLERGYEMATHEVTSAALMAGVLLHLKDDTELRDKWDTYGRDHSEAGEWDFTDEETARGYRFVSFMAGWKWNFCIHNCSQFAGLVSFIEPIGNVSLTPYGLAELIDAEHAIRLRPYLKGRRFLNEGMNYCTCGPCKNAQRKWELEP